VKAVINYSGRASELGGIVNSVDRRRSSLSRYDRSPFSSKSITGFDDRYAVAKFSRSGVWDKVPEGSTLIFGDVRISFQHSVRQVERKLPCQNQLDSFSRFDRTPTCNTQARRNVFVSGGVQICTNLIQSCS